MVKSPNNDFGNGNLRRINFTDLYGGGVNYINIDTINNECGYIYRIFEDAVFSGTSPRIGNSYILIGFSCMNTSTNKVIYGAQIAFAFDMYKIAMRNTEGYHSDGRNWPAWKYIVAS